MKWTYTNFVSLISLLVAFGIFGFTLFGAVLGSLPLGKGFDQKARLISAMFWLLTVLLALYMRWIVRKTKWFSL